jgi:PAS domain S-box-containing protein
LKLKLKTIICSVLLSLFTYSLVAQSGYFQLRGRIYNKNKETLANVSIQVFEGNNSIGESKTSQKGVFSLRFKLNTSFIVEIKKEGYTTKRILVDTNVPSEKLGEFFDLFNLIILDDEGNGDARSKSGLPASKYYYKESVGDFMSEKISSKTNIKQNSQAKINELEAELNNYKILVEQQKQMLTESEGIITQANLIKAQAQHYADSVKKEANKKALSMLSLAQKDTSANKIAVALEKSTKEITKEDFKKLSVDEKEFQSKQNIKKLQQRVIELSSVQHKSSRDSLDLKQNRLSLRKEFFDLAKYQLEIDRLKANTEEDRAKIEQREAQLLMMEQEIIFAEQELENANNKIKLKDLEIKNKNIVLTSFVIGSLLLLILLGFIYYNYRDKKRINKILEYQNQELEKLSIVASETSNAVVITDKDGYFTWVNHGYTRLFGYKLDEVVGNQPKNLINEENDESINALVHKALNEGEVVNYELETASKSGKKIWVQTTVTPILDSHGKVSKLIVIDSDISKIKEAEQKILRQNHQIMASINYGKRIQDAMLPSESLIKSYFPDSFIYFKPRDIVSGDFYWFSVQDDKLFVAAVDCTGHGVPGAFMSLIGNQLLNHIVNERKIYKPSEILKELNKGVIQALSQSKEENEEREDGMDLTICRFDKSKKEVQVACANHTALILAGNNGIQEIEGDAISIGESYSKVDNLEFTNHEIPFQSNSTMYLFSDGYPDQLGGPKNKKFLAGKFKNLLVEHQKEQMDMQFDALNETFNKWKGENKQTDDILVMGIRLL